MAHVLSIRSWRSTPRKKNEKIGLLAVYAARPPNTLHRLSFSRDDGKSLLGIVDKRYEAGAQCDFRATGYTQRVAASVLIRVCDGTDWIRRAVRRGPKEVFYFSYSKVSLFKASDLDTSGKVGNELFQSSGKFEEGIGQREGFFSEVLKISIYI